MPWDNQNLLFATSASYFYECDERIFWILMFMYISMPYNSRSVIKNEWMFIVASRKIIIAERIIKTVFHKWTFLFIFLLTFVTFFSFFYFCVLKRIKASFLFPISYYFLLCKRNNKLYCPSNNDKETNMKEENFSFYCVILSVWKASKRTKKDRNTHKDYNMNCKRFSISFSTSQHKTNLQSFLLKMKLLSSSTFFFFCWSNVLLNFFVTIL